MLWSHKTGKACRHIVLKLWSHKLCFHDSCQTTWQCDCDDMKLSAMTAWEPWQWKTVKLCFCMMTQNYEATKTMKACNCNDVKLQRHKLRCCWQDSHETVNQFSSNVTKLITAIAWELWWCRAVKSCFFEKVGGKSGFLCCWELTLEWMHIIHHLQLPIQPELVGWHCWSSVGQQKAVICTQCSCLC